MPLSPTDLKPQEQPTKVAAEQQRGVPLKALLISAGKYSRIHFLNSLLRLKAAFVTPYTMAKAHTINAYLNARCQTRLKLESITAQRDSNLSINAATKPNIVEYFAYTIQNIWKYRWAMGIFVKNGLKRRYRGSVIGFLWSLIAPLSTMIILSVVFSGIFHADIKRTGIYIFSGLLPWIFFQDAVLKGSQCLLDSESYQKKMMIPKFFFPVVSVAGDAVNFVLSLVSLFALGLVLGIPIGPALALLPLSIALFAAFSFGVVLLCSISTVYMRDLPHILQIALSAGFYLLPIIYQSNDLPPTLRQVALYNPVYWFIGLFRSILCYGKIPSATEWLITTSLALCVVVMGFLLLRRKEDDLIFRL